MLNRPPGGWLLALALVGIVAAACGKKGPPVAPERRLPMPATALRAHIDDGTIVVGWTISRSRADGSSFKDLAVLRLYRREEADDAPLKPAMLSSGRIVGYDEIASIRPGAPDPATLRGDAVEWTDRRGLTPGRRHVYVVTATDSLGRTSPPSERLAVPFLAPPEPPGSVRAVAGDRSVTISWEAPAEFSDGTIVAGPLTYVVLRGAGPDGALGIVTPGGVAGTSFTDTGLDNEAEYRYAVRAMRVDPRVAAVGRPSSAVTATPLDTTPPTPPTNLEVVPSPGALRLAWRPSPEEDVALYVVYRATGTGEFSRVGTTRADITTFIDRDVRSGIGYRYVVTALDRARQPNESAHSNEVRATAP